MKTNPKQPSRRGRPIKAPENFRPLFLLADDAVKILHECGAPSCDKKLDAQERAKRIKEKKPLPPQAWGRSEALLILECLIWPFLLTPSKKESSELRAVPLAFARLFASAPHTMIHALPKIERLLKKRNNSTEFQIAFELGATYKLWRTNSTDLVERYFTSHDQKTWTPKKLLRMTPKILMHARRRVRDAARISP
jgi:hypothetical protein